MSQLYKGKGAHSDFNNIRHVHQRDLYSKFFGQMVLLEVKNQLIRSMTKFQIACKSGHRPSEHLFVLKSVFANFKKQKKPLLVTSIDVSKFFDTETIFDCLDAIYNYKVKGKA